MIRLGAYSRKMAYSLIYTSRKSAQTEGKKKKIQHVCFFDLAH